LLALLQVAELDAEIAEQLVARKRAEAELAKLESTAKLVEEKQAELKQAQDELSSKEAELMSNDKKTNILEYTLEQLRTRHGGGGGEDQSEQINAELSSSAQDEASTPYTHGADHKSSFKIKENLDALEEELAQVQARIEEETIKADVLERELRDVQAEVERQQGESTSIFVLKRFRG